MGSSTSKPKTLNETIEDYLPKRSVVAKWIRAEATGDLESKLQAEAFMQTSNNAFLLPPHTCGDHECLRKARVSPNIKVAALLNAMELEDPVCRVFIEPTTEGDVCWTSRAICFMFEMVREDKKRGLVSPVSKRPFHPNAFQMVYALMDTKQFYTEENLKLAKTIQLQQMRKMKKKGVENAFKLVVCTAANACGMPISLNFDLSFMKNKFDSEDERGAGKNDYQLSGFVDRVSELTDPEFSSLSKDQIENPDVDLSRQNQETLLELRQALEEVKNLVLANKLPRDIVIRHHHY